MERDSLTVLLAKNIKELSDARGWTPAELSRKAKINQTGVYDIVTERSKSPKVATVSKIANALGVPVAELFMTAEERENRASILRVFELLPVAEQRRITVLAEALLQSSGQQE